MASKPTSCWGSPDFFTTLPSGPRNPPRRRPRSPFPQASPWIRMAMSTWWTRGIIASSGSLSPSCRPAAQTPDIAIGQASFTTNGANQGGISASTLAFTSTDGAVLAAFIAFDGAGNLWVADAGNNRVLRFNASVLATGTQRGFRATCRSRSRAARFCEQRIHSAGEPLNVDDCFYYPDRNRLRRCGPPVCRGIDLHPARTHSGLGPPVRLVTGSRTDIGSRYIVDSPPPAVSPYSAGSVARRPVRHRQWDRSRGYKQ